MSPTYRGIDRYDDHRNGSSSVLIFRIDLVIPFVQYRMTAVVSATVLIHSLINKGH